MKISKIYKIIRDNLIYQYFILKNGKNFRVNTLIIGGQRCASTSIINFLSELNNVVTPKNNQNTNNSQKEKQTKKTAKQTTEPAN